MSASIVLTSQLMGFQLNHIIQIFSCQNWPHIIFQRIVLEAAHIWRELAPHFFPADCFGGSSNLEGTGSTLFSDRLFWRKLKFGGNWLHIIFRRIVLEIWRELAPHYFPADCFGGSSNLAGTDSTLFSNSLFWRQLRFGKNWLHIISKQIVLEAAQILRELAPHYFLADCSGNVEGTGSTLLSGGQFWKAAQIWRELAPPYFPTDCFEGSSNLEGTGSTLFSNRLFWRQLEFGGNWPHIIFLRIVLEAAQIWRDLDPHYFPTDCFGNLEGTGSTLFFGRLFRRQLRFGGNWLHIIFGQFVLEAAQIWREQSPLFFRGIVSEAA